MLSDGVFVCDKLPEDIINVFIIEASYNTTSKVKFTEDASIEIELVTVYSNNIFGVAKETSAYTLSTVDEKLEMPSVVKTKASSNYSKFVEVYNTIMR